MTVQRNDILAKLAQQQEQQEAGAESIAKAAAIYFNTMIANGLTRPEALELTAVILTALFSKGKS